MSPSRLIHASEDKLNALANERAKWQIRYNKKAEARRIEQDAITRNQFLEEYPDWEEKKDRLFPRDRRVIELSYGLDDKKENKVFSLAQIGEILCQENGVAPISRQRVQQLKDRAFKILNWKEQND